MNLIITGGFARSIRLKCPKQSDVRPATDFTRQAVFSSLGDLVAGSNVLDVFAGVGCYGLEALSRGATAVTFVDKNRFHLADLNVNLAAVTRNIPQKVDVRIVCADFFLFVTKNVPNFDLVFLDPPYALSLERAAEILLLSAEHLHDGAHIVFEMPADLLPPEVPSLELLKTLGKTGKGKPRVAIFKKRPV
ncbi:MAG: hypothetical protein A2Y14_04495 [Verrucomicrobia bacterium GWF2_51_19]|nr:MAG: hypothetical protein A2Y14_04495 [Verrucomicrobia bacterium GWF2_51_19]HCJ12507.1 methyltransferase [Opitutae bacterium]